jgi:hypothetical protein
MCILVLIVTDWWSRDLVTVSGTELGQTTREEDDGNSKFKSQARIYRSYDTRYSYSRYGIRDLRE